MLVFSGGPFRNDTNLGKTLLSLLSGFNRRQLSQLYYGPQRPNVKACKSFYQINELQLIKSCFGLISKQCGLVINAEDIYEGDTEVETNPRFFLNRRSFIWIPILRDVLWKVSLWNSKKMKQWISAQDASVLFCTLPDTLNGCRIIMSLAKDYHLPVVIYVTDDYYAPIDESTYIARCYYHHRQKLMKELRAYVKFVIGISDIAATEYGDLFDAPSATVYPTANSLCTALHYNPQSADRPVVFRYFGMLSLGRWEVLAALGHVLDKINHEEQKAVLEVYSNSQETSIISALSIGNSCIYKGWVSGDEYYKLLESTDVAVHVEAFSKEMCRMTRVSISTKIADYLGAGKCILAIGKEDLASIQHLENVACVVHNENDLPINLQRLITDRLFRLTLQKKARMLAESEHNVIANPQTIKAILESVNRR